MKKILLLVLILSFFLRFYRLADIPATLNPDEKANGYLAYSLLTTGRDERGNFFPLAVQTFGNWTLIAYPAVTILPVAVLGLSDLAVRLPGAAAGVIGTYLVFELALVLFKKNRLALLAAFFYTISPWGVFFSRISHESNLALTFFLAGLVLFFKRRFVPAAVLFGLTMLTHYAYVVFTPLAVAALVLIYRPKKLLAGAVFAVFVLISGLTLFRGSLGEVKDVGIFDNRGVIYNRVERFADGAAEAIPKLHNKYQGIVYQGVQNYLLSFSPAFLFDKGGEKLLHNLGYFGNLYVFDALFILAGIFALGWFREKSILVLAAWLLITPLSSAFTKDAPSATRLFPMMGVMVLVSAYGAYVLTKRHKLLALAAVFFCSVNFLYFADYYYLHLNRQTIRFMYYGWKQAALVAQQYPNQKVKVIAPEDFSYISFLFYEKFSPDEFRKTVTYYPAKSSGFQFVKSFGRYEFVPAMNRRAAEPGILYIDHVTPEDSRQTIRLPGGEPILVYYTLDDLVSGQVPY